MIGWMPDRAYVAPPLDASTSGRPTFGTAVELPRCRIEIGAELVPGPDGTERASRATLWAPPAAEIPEGSRVWLVPLDGPTEDPGEDPPRTVIESKPYRDNGGRIRLLRVRVT